jgi:hypothetical protein
MADATIFSEAQAGSISRANVLAGLLAHDYVTASLYGDSGPPPSAPTQNYSGVGPVVEGWATLSEPSNDGDYRLVRWSANGVLTHGKFHRSIIDTIEGDASTDAYASLGNDQAKTKRHADGVAVGVADATRVDLYITNRDHLLKSRRVPHPARLDLTSGLALVSLHLRGQGVYRIWTTGNSTFTMSKGTFFWVGARELLPSTWRWLAGVYQHARHSSNEDLKVLPHSVIERVQRALQVRDVVHRALNQPPTGDVSDDAIANFEVALLLLMAATDVTAVVSHVALGIAGSLRDAMWQNENWVARIRARSNQLAQVVDSGTKGKAALTILRHLRNSIHSEPLQGVTVYSGANRPERALFSLPTRKRTEVLEAIEQLGGQRMWGVEVFSPDDMLVDPGILLDRLMRHVLDLLNEVMEFTPIETLPGVSLQSSDLGPPAGDGGPMEIFSPYSRLSIRWQLGL